MLRTCRTFAFAALLAVAALSALSGRYAVRYPYVEQSRLLAELAERSRANASRRLPRCEYASIVADAAPFAAPADGGVDTRRIRAGGEREPHECRARFSTAVIVPYRDRGDQLDRFLRYMHAFLGRQRLHYRLYVVEQDDAKPFNRAKLLNVGAAAAMAHGFPCLVLHDVDLLPLAAANLYACTRAPRHMSSAVDKFRFNLPYEALFGGAVSLLAEQFVAVNGMSNNYFGWGAEDDDLYQRLDAVGLKPCRLSPRVSAYAMMRHRPEKASASKNNLLATARMRHSIDGLNSLQYVKKSERLHPLFTHIVVSL